MRLTEKEVKRLQALKGIESTKSAAEIMGCSIRTVQNYWRFHTIEQARKAH